MIKDMDGMFATIIFGFTFVFVFVFFFFFGSVFFLVLKQGLASGFKLAKYL